MATIKDIFSGYKYDPVAITPANVQPSLIKTQLFPYINGSARHFAIDGLANNSYTKSFYDKVRNESLDDPLAHPEWAAFFKANPQLAINEYSPEYRAQWNAEKPILTQADWLARYGDKVQQVPGSTSYEIRNSQQPTVGLATSMTGQALQPASIPITGKIPAPSVTLANQMPSASGNPLLQGNTLLSALGTMNPQVGQMLNALSTVGNAQQMGVNMFPGMAPDQIAKAGQSMPGASGLLGK